jgi:hypothetical protein
MEEPEGVLERHWGSIALLCFALLVKQRHIDAAPVEHHNALNLHNEMFKKCCIRAEWL